MLAALGLTSVDELFDDIPVALRASALDLPPAEPELLLAARLQALADRNLTDLDSFLGAGVYRHWTPPAVDQLLLRGEWYTAYTPVPARGQPGHPPEHLRIRVADRRAGRPRCRERLALRRGGGHRRGRPDDLPGHSPRPRPRVARRPSALPPDAGDLPGRRPGARGDPARRRGRRRGHDGPGGPRADAGRDGPAGGRRDRGPARLPWPPGADAADRRADPRRRGAVRRGRGAGQPGRPRTTRRVRGGHRRRRGPAAGHRAAVRRAVPGPPRLHRCARSPDPRPARRDDDGPRWPARVRHDDARPRAGHPTRQGRQQHLHEPGAPRPGRLHLSRDDRAARAARRRGAGGRQGRRAGAGPRRGRGASPASRAVPQRVRRPGPGCRAPSTPVCSGAACWPAWSWPRPSRTTRRSSTACSCARPRSPRPRRSPGSRRRSPTNWPAPAPPIRWRSDERHRPAPATDDLRARPPGPRRRQDPASAGRRPGPAAGRGPARHAAGPARDERAGCRPALREPLPAQLRGRHRVLPAGLVHDEVQPEAQRVGRPPARLREPAPARPRRGRPGHPAAALGAGGGAGRDLGDARRDAPAGGGRPGRAHRHPDDPGLPPRAWRHGPRRGPGPGQLPRHEPGDRVDGRATARSRSRPRPTAAWMSTRSGPPSVRARRR